MKNILFAITTIFFSFFFSSCSLSQCPIPKGIYQIVGLWEAKSDEGTLYEFWEMNPDSSLKGKNFILKPNNDTVLLEQLEISCINDTVFYTATVFGQNNDKPVYFKIYEWTQMVFAFENRQHDFPQLIRYSVKTEDIYTVILEGPEPENKIKSVEYRFNRIKNK